MLALEDAFAASYARNGFKLATVGDDVYQLLMEGLESFVGTGQLTGEPAGGRYAIGRDGRRYLTSSPDLAALVTIGQNAFLRY